MGTRSNTVLNRAPRRPYSSSKGTGLSSARRAKNDKKLMDRMYKQYDFG